MNVIPDDFDWKEHYALAERSKLIAPSAVTDTVIDALYGENAVHGVLLPWAKAVDRFRVRPGEVTVWGGYNGHWKSALTTQVALGLARQRERVLVASYEMLPVATVTRMLRQAAGSESPSIAYIRAFSQWADERIWLYDHFGYCDPRKSLAVANYAAHELGVRHVVIDSLMKCVEDPEDYRGQKVFVGDLCALAMATGLHVHLVAHARKCADENAALNRYGLMGSGGVSDQADNVILVQRNKRKEREAESDTPNAEIMEQADLFLRIDKQRHNAFEGTLGLYLDRKAFAFSDAPNGHVKPLNLPLEAAPVLS